MRNAERGGKLLTINDLSTFLWMILGNLAEKSPILGRNHEFDPSFRAHSGECGKGMNRFQRDLGDDLRFRPEQSSPSTQTIRETDRREN